MSAPAAEAAVPGFTHEAFLYRGDTEFLAGVLPFVRDGLDSGETVVVAEPAQRLSLLRTALGPDAAAVRFLDMADVGANPGRILGVWAAALAETRAAGSRLRGVGEPAYPGRRPEELQECFVHELLLNRAFAPGEPWRLLCPYDTRALPTAVSDRALLSHPEWSALAARGSTGTDVHRELAEAFAAPLPPPAGPVLRGRFGRSDLPAVRHTVLTWARRCGLPEDRVDVLELAAGELAANCVEHGGGGSSVALWEQRGAVVVEFTDQGSFAEPLAGRLPPGPEDEGCSGLYVLHQLCDLLQVRAGAAGTTVRVTTWR